MIPDDQLADIFERAVEVIDRDGWIQGSYHKYGRGPEYNGHCVMGGLEVACRELGFDVYSHSLQISLVLTGDGYSVESLNDTPGQTWENLRDKLLVAAKEMK